MAPVGDKAAADGCGYQIGSEDRYCHHNKPERIAVHRNQVWAEINIKAEDTEIIELLG
jgi:hypothetical protein